MDNYIGYSNIVLISRKDDSKDKLDQANINSKLKKVFFMIDRINNFMKKIFFYAIIKFNCIKLSQFKVFYLFE